MGNCGSAFNRLQCGPEVGDEPLDADPGIIGIGALVGFLATALLTYGAIVLGYFTKSLPESYLSDLDHKVVEHVSSSWIGITLAKIWAAIIRFSRKCLFLRPHTDDDDLSEDQRREALRKFVLTLSDQQLVTGIAILVAGFGNWCRMSFYELNMVVALAWFSSATHLATLDVLQDYFQRNRVVRNWRMTGMVTIVLLLIAGLLISGLSIGVSPSSPLPCLTFHDSVVAYDCNSTLHYLNSTYPSNVTVADDGTIFVNSSYLSNCGTYYIFEDFGPEISFGIWSLGSIFTVAYLVDGYATALLRTFRTSTKAPLTPSHVWVYLIFKCLSRRRKDVSMVVVNNVLLKSAIKAKAWSDRMATELSKNPLLKGFGPIWTSSSRAFAFYSASFLYHIGGFSFGLSYGLSQVVEFRWGSSRPLLGAGSNRVDFGQIVPLVLLGLPLLAAAEIWHENDDKKETVPSETPAKPPSTPASSGELGGERESHSTGLGEPEHPNVLSPDPAEPETREATADGPPNATDSDSNGAKGTSSGDELPARQIAFLFSYHVLTSIAVGILLNVNTIVVIAAPILVLVLMYMRMAALVVEVVGASSLLRAAIANGTLDQFKHHPQAADDDTELSNIPEAANPQGVQPDSVSVSTGGASRSGDTGTGTQVANTASESNPHMSEHDRSIQDQNPVASPTASQAQRGERDDDEDHEDRLFVTPSRQDTESGLRRQNSSSARAS